MKKFLGILVLGLLWCNTSNAGSWGEGELQLTKRIADYFIQFVRGGGSKSPAGFYVTLDGTDAMYWYCSSGQGNCIEGSAAANIKICETNTRKKCKKFAFRRTIKWKNGINPGKGKASKINSKWSDSEIYAKLTELGFYKNDFSTNSTKKEEKKETKESKSDIVGQLETLSKLYEAGNLTKEEFKKAKNKLLN